MTMELVQNPDICRKLDGQAIDDIALGATFLGAGGGGDTYATVLQLKELFKAGKQVSLISPDALAEDDLVAPCGWLGAPGVQKEKYPSGEEGAKGLALLEEVLGRPVRAIMPIEIGGQNGIAPFVISAQTGVPVLDCDAMGRAFPKANMVTFNIYGCSATPAVATDTHGNSVVLRTLDNAALERIVRGIAVSMGGHCHLFDYPLSARDVRRYAVPGTISLSRQIGRGVRRARETGAPPVQALMAELVQTLDYRHVFRLFDGKVVDIQRQFDGGFLVGEVVMAGTNQTDSFSIRFQNEYIHANRNGKLVASVPDIIAVVDRETATPINTENLKYGQRVVVLGCSVSDLLRRKNALRLLGPAAFDLPFAYTPIEWLNDVPEERDFAHWHAGL